MKRFHLKMGLRGQLVLLFLLVSLIPLLVVSFMTRALGVNALENTIGKSLVQLSKEKLDRADQSISVRLKAIQRELEAIHDAVDSANRNANNELKLFHAGVQLEDNLRRLEDYAGAGSQIIITNSHRQILRATGVALIPHFPKIDVDWWYKAYNNGLGYTLIENVEYDLKAQHHYLPIALPIRHKTKVVGVLRALITLPELSEIVKKPVDADELGSEIDVFVVNRFGRVIAAPPESGYSFREHIEMSDAVMEGVINSDAAYGYKMRGEADIAGERKIYGWARTRRWEAEKWADEQNFIHWTVLVSQPESVAFQEIDQLTRKVLFFTVISCFVVIPIAWLVSQRIVTPIMQVARAARAVGQGKFDQDIPITSGDEVGILAEEFNAMRWNLKYAIEKITKEEKKMTAIVNSLAEGLILVDSNNRVLHINPAAEYLLGVNVNQIGEDFTQLIQDGELTKVLTESQRQVALNKTAASEVPVDRNGEQLILRVVASPFLDENGAILGTVYVFDDITREKEIDRMKSDFVSLVSHELRTPLTSIIGFVSFILDGKAGAINEKQRNSLMRVQRQSKRLTALINDLLDVSRIEAGRIQMNQSAISIREIANHRIEEIRPQADAKSIALELIAPEFVPTIIGDEERLGQVFTNLIGNAIKFTPENGAITIKLEVDSNLIHVEIIDTGPGIPPEERQKIFDKFYQMSDFRTRQQGGSGLGLSIVKSIVEAHGGKVWVDDGIGGKGSNFQFTLPMTSTVDAERDSEL
jgi:PAS domain S-box-containing protein